MTSFVQPANTLVLYRGQTKRLDLVLADGGVPLDLTGGRVLFTVKKSRDAVDAIIQKSSDNGPDQIDVVNAKQGVVAIYLLTNDTRVLDEGRYFYDVWAEVSAGGSTARFPVIEPTFFIVKGTPTAFPRQ